MEQHAVAAAQDNKCYGTKASFNLWQPTIARSNDFSLSQFWVSAGSYSGNDLNTIEAGWQVRPEVETQYLQYFLPCLFFLHQDIIGHVYVSLEVISRGTTALRIYY